jgi:hypothetical protein
VEDAALIRMQLPSYMAVAKSFLNPPNTLKPLSEIDYSARHDSRLTGFPERLTKLSCDNVGKPALKFGRGSRKLGKWGATTLFTQFSVKEEVKTLEMARVQFACFLWSKGSLAQGVRSLIMGILLHPFLTTMALCMGILLQCWKAGMSGLLFCGAARTPG